MENTQDPDRTFGKVVSDFDEKRETKEITKNWIEKMSRWIILDTPVRRLNGISYWIIGDAEAIYDFVNTDIRKEWENDVESTLLFWTMWIRTAATLFRRTCREKVQGFGQIWGKEALFFRL